MTLPEYNNIIFHEIEMDNFSLYVPNIVDRSENKIILPTTHKFK